MMPVEWPLAPSEADRRGAPAHPRAGRTRLTPATADFFLEESGRLSDEERSLMAAMLRGLVHEVADELIAALAHLNPEAAFIRKPFTTVELLAKVREVLDRTYP